MCWIFNVKIALLNCCLSDAFVDSGYLDANSFKTIPNFIPLSYLVSKIYENNK